MIEELNKTVWVTLAPSRVHGIGVHAIRDILKGQRIYAVRDRQEGKWYTDVSYNRLHVLEGLHVAIARIILQRWPKASLGASFQSPNDDARLICFMNHSSEPNYDFNTDSVLRDIKEGEELFENYGPIKFDTK